MLRPSMLAAAAVLTLGLWALPTPSQAVPNPAKAETFVKNLAGQAASVVKDKALAKSIKDSRLREILRGGFDVATIGKFALGIYRRRASPAQIKAYLSAFENFLVYTYSKRFGKYAGETVKVLGDRAAGRSKTDLFVRTEIIREGKEPITVDWRIRDRKGTYLVIDIEIEGTSQALTYRQEFASVIERRGKGVDGLIDELRAKNAKLKAESESERAASTE